MSSFDAVAALFQAHLANHPLLLFAAALAIVTIAQRLGVGRAPMSDRAMLIAGSAALTVYLLQVVCYALGDNYYDHAEPSVAAVSWLAIRGQPIYHDLASAPRYSHIYGPWAFLLPGAVLWLLGPSIVASKVAGAGAGILSVLASFLALRRATSVPRAVGYAGIVALGFLMFRNYAFWNRPDALLALGVSTAILGVTSARPIVRETVVGVSLGLMAGLKITGPLYVLAPLVLLADAGGWKALARVAILAALVWVLPYALWPHADWRAHASWLELSASSGLTRQLLLQNAAWMTFLVLPIVQRWLSRSVRLDRPVLATLCGMAAVSLLAAKPGAGPYHLLPFIPVLVCLDAGALTHPRAPDGRGRRAWRAAHLVTAVVMAAGSQAYFLAGLHRTDWPGLARELTALLDTPHLARAPVGYADAGPSTYLRPLAVFRSGTYLLDAPAVQEHQLAGMEIPEATIDALRRCDVPAWILPRGEPFSAVNAYPQTGHRRLFSKEFREAFFAMYARTASGTFFDVWTCTRPSGEPSRDRRG